CELLTDHSTSRPYNHPLHDALPIYGHGDDTADVRDEALDAGQPDVLLDDIADGAVDVGGLVQMTPRDLTCSGKAGEAVDGAADELVGATRRHHRRSAACRCRSRPGSDGPPNTHAVHDSRCGRVDVETSTRRLR